MQQITVYDYNNTWHGSRTHQLPKDYTVKKMEVNASCVGGIEGILAFFIYEDYFCIAGGDDGEWWLIYTCHKKWKNKIKEAVKNFLA